MRSLTFFCFLAILVSCRSSGPGSDATPIVANGLTVEGIGKSYARSATRTPDGLYFDEANLGGSTSVRREDSPNLDWKPQGYFQRNRELGQVFTVPTGKDLTLDAIVLRTGNSSSAVKPGAGGAAVQLQLFEVMGRPRIDDNGTPAGTGSRHGFTDNHRADDFLTGIRYRPLLLARGGRFPDLPPTDRNGEQEGHLHYLRWDLRGDAELTLAAGKRYAFLVGFGEAGADRGFTLGNDNLAADPAAPSLRTDPNGNAWWSIRREGDGTLPPTAYPGTSYPADADSLAALRKESLFAEGYEFTLPPATDGYPDVDTYRAFEFYVEVR